MHLYRDVVFPRIVNLVMNTESSRELRQRVCAGLAGDVVEIGFGTGHNLPFLPPEVTRLRAVDPMRTGAKPASSSPPYAATASSLAAGCGCSGARR